MIMAVLLLFGAAALPIAIFLNGAPTHFSEKRRRDEPLGHKR
jgi:hypothetical protein